MDLAFRKGGNLHYITGGELRVKSVRKPFAAFVTEFVETGRIYLIKIVPKVAPFFFF